MFVFGSSPNALITAGYLQHAGHQVTVIEPDLQFGAIAECLPSLRIDPTVLRELELHLEVRHSQHKVGLASDGRWVRLSREGLEGDVSASDQRRWPEFVQLLDHASKLLHAAYLRAPQPDSQSDLVEPWRALGERTSRETLRLPWISLKDLLEEWFESDLLQGTLAAIGLRGVLQGPYASGTGFGLLHQWATGEALERTSHPRAVVDQLVEQLRSRGVELRNGVPVQAIEVQDDRAVGLRLDDERVLETPGIFSDYDGPTTFRRWMNPRQLETAFLAGLNKVRFNGCVALARKTLNEIPAGPAPLTAEEWSGGVILNDGLRAVERSFDPTKYGGHSASPVCELVFEDGVVKAWGQFYPWRNRVESGTFRQALGKRFPELGWESGEEWLPSELADRFRIHQGHLGGGELTINQAFFLRPQPEYESGRFPLEDLYLCGAAVHPGGHSGLAGRLAAHQALKSLALA